MTTTTNETSALTVVRRLLDEGFATGDASIVDELCSVDVVEHQFGLSGSGEEARDKIRQAIRDVHAMSPDLTYTIEDFAEVGDTVWVRATGRGTATGPFFGPPSGRPIELTVIDVARVVDGQVVEHWGVPDRFALLAQTGALARLR